MSVKSDAQAKIIAYRAEIRRSRQRSVLGYFLLFLCAVLLYMVSAGARYNHILRYVGLHGISNEEGGVYTDCSKDSNRDIRYCQPRSSGQQKTWQSLQRNGGKTNPFTLYSDSR